MHHYEDLMRADGTIKPKVKTDFEQFLVEEHAQQYDGAKDGMNDSFDDWLENLTVDEWITFGNFYAKTMVKP